jgi:ATP-dependent DNA helicase RecG
MLLSELTQDVSTVRGVGPVLAARLARLGVSTLAELLFLLPRGYEDRTSAVPLSQAAGRDKTYVVATVTMVTEIGWGRSRTIRAVISDGSTEAALTCFGRQFLRGVLQPGRRFHVWGTFSSKRGQLESTDFELEPWSESPAGFGRILPVYPLT